MEGGFNKAMLLTLENGTEVVAKIPCANAGPAIYSTASEAVVLHYGKSLDLCCIFPFNHSSEIAHDSTGSQSSGLELERRESYRRGIYHHGEGSRKYSYLSFGRI